METAVLGGTGMDGRMKRDYALGGKYIVMGHNTIRGAAGCAVLPELLKSKEYL